MLHSTGDEKFNGGICMKAIIRALRTYLATQHPDHLSHPPQSRRNQELQCEVAESDGLQEALEEGKERITRDLTESTGKTGESDGQQETLDFAHTIRKFTPVVEMRTDQKALPKVASAGKKAYVCGTHFLGPKIPSQIGTGTGAAQERQGATQEKRLQKETAAMRDMLKDLVERFRKHLDESDAQGF